MAQHGPIARSYLRFWFWTDFLSVLPLSLILNSVAAMEVKHFARILRLARLQKLLKMVKLIRMMRLVKQRAKMREQLSRLGATPTASTERLLLFLLVFFILAHVAACLWLLLAKLDDFSS